MSNKRLMVELLERLPDDVSCNEAFDRLYEAFKQKLAREDEQAFAKAPPLPTDPQVLAELRAEIDAGLQEARDGKVTAWAEVDQQIRTEFSLPPA